MMQIDLSLTLIVWQVIPSQSFDDSDYQLHFISFESYFFDRDSTLENFALKIQFSTLFFIVPSQSFLLIPYYSCKYCNSSVGRRKVTALHKHGAVYTIILGIHYRQYEDTSLQFVRLEAHITLTKTLVWVVSL